MATEVKEKQQRRKAPESNENHEWREVAVQQKSDQAYLEVNRQRPGE